MQIIVIFVIIFLTLPLHAQTLAFERLFSTASQRAELNSSRERLIQGLDTPEQLEEEQPAQEERAEKANTLQELLLPRAKYNGLIIRANGKTDYWVNGRSTSHKTALGKELKTKTHRHGTRLTLEISDQERIWLQPGQVFSFARDRKFEGYQDPHRDKGQKVADDVVTENVQQPQVATSVNDQTVSSDLSPTDVFDESFLIKEIQKIQLLEQRLQNLETGNITP